VITRQEAIAKIGEVAIKQCDIITHLTSTSRRFWVSYKLDNNNEYKELIAYYYMDVDMEKIKIAGYAIVKRGELKK
jgi:Bacteriophage T holin